MFRAWGRIGTTIGGTKLDLFPSLQEATKLFKAKYEEETGNPWSKRHNFRKVPHRMVPMDLDMGEVRYDFHEILSSMLKYRWKHNLQI